MPRPAIVIGVGGTGSWVLSWLKKDLLETYGSLKDLPVRLLLLDVADIITEVGSAQTVENNQYGRFNDIDPKREFIQLPTDKTVSTTRSLDEAVRRGDERVSHLGRWFCGGHFPVAALSLSDGAGQFRQLGRLSLVQGLHQSGTADPVYAKLQTIVNEIVSLTRAENAPSIDIHITGSFAGGSGGGLFLDVAWLMRKIVPNNIKIFVNGMFAMPSVFTRTQSRGMQAKAFNAWRELNRMMTVDPDNSSFMLRWGTSDETIYDVVEPVYDHVYLIDGGPGGQPLTSEPKDSVFPIMAEAVSFFLDDQSGEQYIQHITTNLNKRKIAYPFKNRPTFSTLYVKSWKQPVYHNVNVARHRFAMRYLETLLQIQQSEETDASGQIREVYSLMEMHLCYQKSVEIFGAEMAGIGNTQFIAELARIVNIPHADKQLAVRGYADGAYNMLNMFASMPVTPEGRAVTVDIQELVNFDIPRVDVTNDADYVRGQLYDVERMLYGGSMRNGGEYASMFGDFEVNRNKGKLYDKLKVAEQFHLGVFRERIQDWVARELNSAGDGHSGLACVISALEELVRQLEFLITFFEDVEKVLPPVLDFKADAEHYFQQALGQIDGGLVDKVMGRPKKVVGAWGQAEVSYLSLQRDRRAIQRIVSTLNEMYDFTKSDVLKSIRAISQQLVTDNTVDRVQGLYRGLQASLEDEHNRHAFDQRLSSVTKLLSAEGTVPDPDIEEIMELINRTEWTVDDNMNIRVSIQVSDNEPPIELEANANDSEQTIRLVQDLVVRVADRIVVNVDSKTAMDVLDLNTFAQELPDCRNTLFYQSPTTPQLEEVRTFYIRANATPGQAQELRDIMGSLGLPSQDPHTLAVVGSQNSDKIVVFSARELLLPENFAQWEQCRDAYQRQVHGDSTRGISANYQQVRCDHLFAAEKNALEMEYRYYENTGDFPITNHRIVHLLEERPRLEDFLRLWVLGWIHYENAVEQQLGPTWVIEMPDAHERDMVVLAPDEGMDMIDIMARYVIHGRDVRGNLLPYKRLITRMQDHINEEWFQDEAKSEEMVEIFRLEAQTNEEFAHLISRGINSDYTPDEFRDALRDKLDELRDREDYRETLAESVAIDFTKKRTSGEPLISNTDAHLQLLDVVLKQIFNELAQSWENRMSRPSSNNDRSDRRSSRRGRDL